MRRRLASCALCMCWAGTVLAAAPVGTAAEDADYVDRVLDDSPQAEPADEPESRATGWPRGWSVEAQSTRQGGPVRAHGQSLLLSGHLDTPDHGTLSAHLSLERETSPAARHGPHGATGTPYSPRPYGDRSGGTWRVDQRAMPFDRGWFGNASAGDIHMASTPLARAFGRLLLPSPPIEGVSASFEQPGRTSFNASAGRLGYFDGISFQDFPTHPGQAVGAGAQTRLRGGDDPFAPGRADAAVQAIETRGVNGNGMRGHARNTRSIWTTAAWQGVAPWADGLGAGLGGVGDRVGGLRLQGHLAHSASQPSGPYSLAPPDAGTGAWLDAAWRTGLVQQAASLFRFEPSLRWGSEALPGDLRGASWRGDVSTRQWQLGGSIELSDSVSGLPRRSLFGNLFGRHRLDSRDALSATLAARSGIFAAQSAQWTWEHQSRWGYTQWRTDAARGIGLRVLRSGVDHAWNVAETQSFSTSLAVEQSRHSSFSERKLHWGVLGTTQLAGGARLDLGVRGSHGMGDSSSRFLSANARLSWPLGPGWSFIAQYAASRGRESLNPAVVSALTAAMLQPLLVAPPTHSLMVALRYEGRAGLASAPIGGAPGSGAGRLEGYVFFDQDNNERREANEAGVPGVTVLLNRRYLARTDGQGFYSFPSVAAGSHELELIEDNVPLPWRGSGAPSRRVEVYVRDTVAANFPVRKEP